MATWYVASNITPGDNSGLDMCPNPGDYTDLNDGDIALVMIRNVVTSYTYDATSALTESLPQVITPNGNAGNGRWILSAFASKGQNGFNTPIGPQSDSLATIGVSGSTFTLTHVADYDFYINGVVYRKTGNETVEITDVHGLHIIYFDSEGVMQCQPPGGHLDDLILDNCLVAMAYWDATSNYVSLLFDERHGSSMSPATHYHLHESLGAQYDNGLSLSGFSTDGTGDDAVDAQFDINSGEFHDEDNEISIPTDTNATIDTFFRQGVGGPWFKLAATAGYPVADGAVGTQLDWNDYNGGSWQLQEVTTGRFVLTHYFATNDVLSDAGVIGIMGQNTYLSLNSARTGAEVELGALLTGDLPMPELLPIATVIWQTAATYGNQVAARIRSTDTGDDYIDWRTTLPVGSGSTTVDHESLANLFGGASADHYHLTSAQNTALTTGVKTNLHSHDTIVDGDSNVTVTDAGAGSVEVTVDGNSEMDITDAGMRLGGANSRVSAILDEDNMASDSDTSIATQQSIKAYVRDNAGDPALPKLDFYQDWLQRTKYQNASVVTCIVSGTLIDTTTMDHDIENRRYNFTVGETILTEDLYDSSLSLSNITECIIDAEITDDAAGTLQVSNDGGSNFITVTDTTQVVTFVTSGIDLVLKYTAGGTGYVEHMGVLYNPDTIFAPDTEIVVPGDNVIINGDMEIDQRGEAGAAANFNDWLVDRFRYKGNGSFVHTISQNSSPGLTVAQSGHTSSNSIKLDCTTVDATIGAAEFGSIGYIVEGYDYNQIAGLYGTLSFWVKATKTGIYCVTFRDNPGTTSYVVEYTVTASDTWEKVTMSVLFDESLGTWDHTTSKGLHLDWMYACGTDYQTTAGSWVSGIKLATSNQVNAVDNTDNNFEIAQVKLEAGQVATPWKARPFAEELALCQRYYEKTYDVAVVPGTVTGTGLNYWRASGTTLIVAVPQMVQKRAVGTGYLYSPVTGTVDNVRNYTAGADVSAGISFGTGEHGRYVQVQGLTDEDAIGFHWAADAEL